jgi:hypothetical protein
LLDRGDARETQQRRRFEPLAPRLDFARLHVVAVTVANESLCN